MNERDNKRDIEDYFSLPVLAEPVSVENNFPFIRRVTIKRRVAETSRRRSVAVMNVAVKTSPTSATTMMDSTETDNA